MGNANFSAYSGVVNAFDFKDMVEDMRLKQEDIKHKMIMSETELTENIYIDNNVPSKGDYIRFNDNTVGRVINNGADVGDMYCYTLSMAKPCFERFPVATKLEVTNTAGYKYKAWLLKDFEPQGFKGNVPKINVDEEYNSGEYYYKKEEYWRDFLKTGSPHSRALYLAEKERLEREKKHAEYVPGRMNYYQQLYGESFGIVIKDINIHSIPSPSFIETDKLIGNAENIKTTKFVESIQESLEYKISEQNKRLNELLNPGWLEEDLVQSITAYRPKETILRKLLNLLYL